MKFIFSQMAFFLTQQNNRRNLRVMRNFFLILFFLVTIYSIVFHYIMLMEDRHYSPVTGLYWTLTVMSTLGFGDITFESDTGKMFTMLVLASGIILIMLVMPFTFIRFIYVPWLDAQTKARTPRKLPESTHGHTLIVGSDFTALSIAEKLHTYNMPYCLLVDTPEIAFNLHEQEYSVMQGETDTAQTYIKAQAANAALIIALYDEYKNTNIASTVREVAPNVPLAATADHETAKSILLLAGCNHVYCFAALLGQSMARRVYDTSTQSHIIGQFEGLCIAEAPATHSRLIGQTILSSGLKDKYSLNAVGIWQGNQYIPVGADTKIEMGTVLLLAGTAHDLERYDRDMIPEKVAPQPPIIILGGGRVGTAASQALTERSMDFRLVEKNVKVLPKHDNTRYIHGDASDLSILTAAGIEKASTVVITTHNDDVNIYLTIFCRKLRPELQIISRASLDRNVASLYSAGASLVMSQASYTANTILNLLQPEQVFMLTEGLNIFRIKTPPKLIGENLIKSGIRENAHCNIVGICRKGELEIPPNPMTPLTVDDELLIIGTAEDEICFRQKFLDMHPSERSPGCPSINKKALQYFHG